MSDKLRRQWLDLLRTWAVDSLLAEQTFEEVCQHYTGPGRFYHTLDHIQSVLEIVDRLGSHARNRNVVLLAAWLHDVIYDSRAADNEERSAEYAEQLCVRVSLPPGRMVADLIRKTRTHDAGGDADAEILLDADLAILGASEDAYQTYAEQIRQEYAWVPEADYRQGRRRVLQSFLSRPRIYHWLVDREAAARRNLAAEIARY